MAVEPPENKCLVVSSFSYSLLPQYVCMVTHIGKSMDQPGKVANPARGQPDREGIHYAFAPENLVYVVYVVHY